MRIVLLKVKWPSTTTINQFILHKYIRASTQYQKSLFRDLITNVEFPPPKHTARVIHLASESTLLFPEG